ncbi:hypothetical protein ERO13_D05G223732v2 [Gossypium hirsutum]|uniref:Uncharacterized protein n=2 Tax=Gossypium TaxID=3633 RepID=A0A5J5RJP6_GOSBA|nr:hypothetical protein ES319_D05G232800v1 [Gossypium barbadense]KAG4147450.1 hypothetical protein ERO13_D05G223732v2 [Gossypium hirsutum]TYI82678.1 hypothetical protein E1A91_D05G237000v1 [Gossypium mustelinum]
MPKSFIEQDFTTINLLKRLQISEKTYDTRYTLKSQSELEDHESLSPNIKSPHISLYALSGTTPNMKGA